MGGIFFFIFMLALLCRGSARRIDGQARWQKEINWQDPVQQQERIRWEQELQDWEDPNPDSYSGISVASSLTLIIIIVSFLWTLYNWVTGDSGSHSFHMEIAITLGLIGFVWAACLASYYLSRKKITKKYN